MQYMKSFFLAACLSLMPVTVFAQQAPGTPQTEKRVVVSTCGTVGANYTAGNTPSATMDTTGKDCVNIDGTSLSVTGTFYPYSLGQTTKAASVPVVSANDPDLRPTSGNITTRDIGSATTTGQNSATIITGTPTALSFQSQAINGQSGSRILVSGTWTGTLEIDGSLDSGTTWTPIPVRVVGSSFTGSSLTANGQFDTDVSAMTNIRVRATAAMTGTATVSFVFTQVAGPVQILNPLRIFDNVSGALETIKPASTSPASTDTATVVSLHPMGNNVGGYDFQLSPTITVQNAAYAAGNSEGGLITVTNAARTNGGSGILNGLRLRSAGGSTNTIWIYAWSKTPVATCTDKSAYVSSSTDAPYALTDFPTSVTLGPNPGTWDATTYARLTNLVDNFKNQDTSPGTAIYLCLVTAGSVTPATTSDLSVILGGVQD